MTNPLTPLHTTSLTTRCHNPFFRQKQLKALHDTLRHSLPGIVGAIKADSGVSDREASLEAALALDLVKRQYAAIDPAQELDDEYRVARGRDAVAQRKPWGVVYIAATQHTMFFSVVAALSAAVAGGNCVAVKLEKNLRAVPALLRTLLAQALEPDTFVVVSSTPSQDALKGCLQVLQEGGEEPRYDQLSSPQRKTIAIIDRTADLAAAAEFLVSARFAFGGTSPYAPDVVFVNEYVESEFLEHVLEYATAHLASNGPSKPNIHMTSALAALGAEATMLSQSPKGAVVSLPPLSSLPAKLTSPLLAISPITSLEHALSLVDASAPLLAGYYFGTPATGNYLSQFVQADVAFVNQVPAALLLGPGAPEYHGVDVGGRYNVGQFTRAAPVFVRGDKSARVRGDESARVLGGDGNADEALRKAGVEIREKKRAEWIAIGFFEQGILVGLGLVGVPLLACVGTGVVFGVRAGMRRFLYSV